VANKSRNLTENPSLGDNHAPVPGADCKNQSGFMQRNAASVKAIAQIALHNGSSFLCVEGDAGGGHWSMIPWCILGLCNERSGTFIGNNLQKVQT
jgi:hypothetical protein